MLKYSDYDIVFQEVPDEVSLALNISCCPNRCEGCHSPQLQQDIGEILDEDELSELLKRYGGVVTCVLFMGGDNDPSAVERLCLYIKKNTKLKRAWYSGRNDLPKHLSLFDYIKLGSYVKSLGPLNSPNTNQRFYKVHHEGELEDISSIFLKH